MKNKTKFVWAIAIAVAGLMMTSAVSLAEPVQEETTIKVSSVEREVSLDVSMAKTMKAQDITSSCGPLSADPIVLGKHPAISSDITETVVLGFETNDDPSSVYFTASADGGATWNTNAIGWTLTEPPELPCIDMCGDGRVIGGMVPNYLATEGSELYKPVSSDPNNIPDGWGDMSYWSWLDLGYFDFTSVATAGYTSGDPDEDSWAYGAHSMVGDHDGASGADTNFFSYQMTPDGYAWIYRWTGVNGCQFTSMDIDHDTLYAYGVWNFDNLGLQDLYIAKFDFGTWEEEQGYPIHPGVGADKTIETSGNDDYFDVSVYMDNAIIVSQRDGDIVCYYSADGFNSVSEVEIETGATNPKVAHTGEDMATLEFIKDGSVYYASTEDGGATWSTPEAVDGSDNVEEDQNAADICGYGAAWMDTEPEETTIYFQYLDILPDYPFLEVISITGGLGVTAVIKNTGSAAATNVEAELTVTGGILGLINKNATTAETSLAVDGEMTISSGIILGLGAIEVAVSATCDEGLSADGTASGTQLFIFSRI